MEWGGIEIEAIEMLWGNGILLPNCLDVDRDLEMEGQRGEDPRAEIVQERLLIDRRSFPTELAVPRSPTRTAISPPSNGARRR